MSDWQFNIGLGLWARGYGGATLGTSEALGGAIPHLGLELSPGFIGGAQVRHNPSGQSDTYGSFEIAPIGFIGSRATSDGARMMLTGGAGVQLRVPIPIETSTEVIHPIAPYVSMMYVTHDDASVGPGDVRFSLGADFAIYEDEQATIGLNANASMVSDDEFSIGVGISGSFDAAGQLRYLTF